MIGREITRRRFMKVTAAGTIASLAAPAVIRAAPANAKGIVRIGHVTPLTGPSAAFGEPYPYVLKYIQERLKDGISIGGEPWAVEILSRDSQSSANRAAEVASELILRDEVNLMLCLSTPDCVNPVSDQAEINGVPCISTNCPWQPYVFGRNGEPVKGFEWTYHFFWGLEDATQGYVGLWNSTSTNRIVGALITNDADGNAWNNKADPGALRQTCARNNFELIVADGITVGAQDFSAQIALFKSRNVEIVTGVLYPPDFGIFWQQCAQQNFRPKIVTIAKALLFPSVISALGDSGDGLSTEIWWSPHHPFKSGLTGQTAKDFAAGYTSETGRPWTQPMGFNHALFEVAIDVLQRTKDVQDPASILESIKATDYNSIVGHIKWDNPNLKNIAKTSVVAGQWTKTPDGFDLIVCDNFNNRDIPIGGKLRPLA